MHKVFYSWQSNTEEKSNRYLIRDALERAITRLNLDLELDEATRGQPGSRMIFETICQKIAACAIFVPDVTFSGRSDDGRKRLPNPNVLVEYGFALAKIGEDRIVPVMNAAFGPIEELPFDLRHRPIRLTYRLAPDATSEERKRERDELAGRIAAELRMVFESGALYGGLSPEAVRIVHFMAEHSEHGVGGPGDYGVDDLADALALDPAEANTLLNHLAAVGYVARLPLGGTDAPPASPTNRLFWRFDQLIRGTDPTEDAKTVAQAMLKSGGSANCEALRQELGWEVRRMNPALTLLEWAHLVLASDETSYPLAVSYIKTNDRTEAFLSGLLDPHQLRTRGGF